MLLFLTTTLAALATALPTENKLSPIKRDTPDSSWCGAVINGSYTTVEASWTVPSAHIPRGGDTSQLWEGYQWVGIDGWRGCNVILQGGTGQSFRNGQVSNYFWYEFYPAYPQAVNLGVSQGDQVYVKVTATSRTAGYIYYENRSTGQSTTQHLTAPSGSSLCFNTVEWVQEDPAREPFPAFSNFQFDNAVATTNNGGRHGIDGAEYATLYRNGNGDLLCHANGHGSNTLAITYDGPQ